CARDTVSATSFLGGLDSW
nr:immunoglobulin heavy chain junction region [Macaca mulatta]MOV58392.1 immunoglobulin heavy chain junction region [Macaca mulatta]MOV58709.1 immunoglobulin heavy chain junction region [Macaca mulatta]MOV58742.1 immunoglobulin heavy chain junction region [Macaca mulatta]MOV59765.1 immunoglobulin heavy chain junction region [Macaca mulatta]